MDNKTITDLHGSSRLSGDIEQVTDNQTLANYEAFTYKHTVFLEHCLTSLQGWFFKSYELFKYLFSTMG